MGDGVRSAVVAGFVVSLLVTGCSAGDRPVLDVASSAASVSSTVASSLPVSTVPSPTVAPSVMSSAAQAVPSVAEQARAAVVRAIGAFRSCLVALPACDVSVLPATRSGALLQRNVARVEEWNAAGLALRGAEQFRFVVEEIRVDAGGRRATVTVCSVDGSRLVKPAAGPGGADVVVDGAFVASREAWDVRLDPDGVWRAYDAPVVGAVESRDVCPAG